MKKFPDEKSCLPGWDDFRTFKWIDSIDNPEKWLDDVRTWLLRISL